MNRRGFSVDIHRPAIVKPSHGEIAGMLSLICKFVGSKGLCIFVK